MDDECVQCYCRPRYDDEDDRHYKSNEDLGLAELELQERKDKEAKKQKKEEKAMQFLFHAVVPGDAVVVCCGQIAPLECSL